MIVEIFPKDTTTSKIVFTRLLANDNTHFLIGVTISYVLRGDSHYPLEYIMNLFDNNMS